MTLWRLIWKEVLHRRLNSALAVLSVAVAVGVLVAEVVLLRAHDVRTETMLQSRQQEADRRLAVAEDDYRKYMKELGFNLLILPREQELAEFWEKGYATHTLPEDSVRKLSESGTTLMRHLLPIVQQNVFWPEQKRRIILVGTRGEVPIRQRGQMEPMIVAVPEGKVRLGHQLASDLGLKPGDAVALLGTQFVVEECYPERGSADDATVWMNLATAQQLLDMPGRINAIEALKCYCAGGEGGEALREEVLRILPEAKVILRENKVTVRAKARERIKEAREKETAGLAATRAQMRSSREAAAAILVPLVILGAAVWIGLLTLGNVRERRAEIGLLRAIGLRSRSVALLFLAKAALIGLIGALLGYGAGFATGLGAAARDGGDAMDTVAAGNLFSPLLLALVLLAAPLLAAAASWVPATLAGQQDPAVVLREG